jgi:glucose-6-phosphate isomerase
MANLARENGKLMLDWVDGVPRLLEAPHVLDEIEAEARDIAGRGIRDIIWSGMGGSVMAVRVLTDLGYCGPGTRVRIHPLDSTDPAALNAVLQSLAERRGIDLTAPPYLPTLFSDVMMIAVSMGMTSEEPITHLEWFLGLLDAAELAPADHVLVMTLPGSYLDDRARERSIPRRPLQANGGNGTPGRLSAPTTRVFLLPAALALQQRGEAPGSLRAALQRAWRLFDLDAAETSPERHPSVQLAAHLADTGMAGACLLMLRLPGVWEALFPWIEQLMEESLGKGGKGVAVFEPQPVAGKAHRIGDAGVAHVDTAEYFDAAGPPSDSGRGETDLGSLAAAFLQWELTTALYGYLEGIVFAGQPAVENYKARARVLRHHDDPLDVARESGVSIPYRGSTLILPPGSRREDSAVEAFARLLEKDLTYLDITVNGELHHSGRTDIERALRQLGNEALGVPVKLRRAPAAYHSTEQMEMDGVRGLVSLRTVTTGHQPVFLGHYGDTFLKAQAVATWQAMHEGGQPCALLIVEGSDDAAVPILTGFLEGIIRTMGGRNPVRPAH